MPFETPWHMLPYLLPTLGIWACGFAASKVRASRRHALPGLMVAFLTLFCVLFQIIALIDLAVMK